MKLRYRFSQNMNLFGLHWKNLKARAHDTRVLVQKDTPVPELKTMPQMPVTQPLQREKTWFLYG